MAGKKICIIGTLPRRNFLKFIPLNTGAGILIATRLNVVHTGKLPNDRSGKIILLPTQNIFDMDRDQRMDAPVTGGHLFFYAVYDSCVTNNIPGSEIAFIEQRHYAGDTFGQVFSNEKYFLSLREAKLFARKNFLEGAEYFSSNQLNDPDNFYYFLVDKLTYLMA